MNVQPFERPPRWWSPLLSRRWIRFWRPLRLRDQVSKYHLVQVETQGLQHVRAALDQGQGVLITPNHSTHVDGFALYAAADELQVQLYVMAAWQVFVRGNWLRQLVLRHHGLFSVDREGTDLNAVRTARKVLETEPHPLVIFPEGEVYHINERITPFREGPAAIALLSARKADRKIACIPCAMTYHYTLDPTPELLPLMDRLEKAMYWRPRPDLTLAQRIYHLAEGMLALKEIEYLGRTSAGSLAERVREFTEFVLLRIEARYGLPHEGVSVPERVKGARQLAIRQLEELPAEAPERCQLREDLDDLFMVIQAFSYPGDYVAEQASLERIAETLDKFEEDVLGVPTATIRGQRAGLVTFGEPVVLDRQEARRTNAAALTRLLEQRVQSLLDATIEYRQQRGVDPGQASGGRA